MSAYLLAKLFFFKRPKIITPLHTLNQKSDIWHWYLTSNEPYEIYVNVSTPVLVINISVVVKPQTLLMWCWWLPWRWRVAVEVVVVRLLQVWWWWWQWLLVLLQLSSDHVRWAVANWAISHNRDVGRVETAWNCWGHLWRSKIYTCLLLFYHTNHNFVLNCVILMLTNEILLKHHLVFVKSLEILKYTIIFLFT